VSCVRSRRVMRRRRPASCGHDGRCRADVVLPIYSSESSANKRRRRRSLSVWDVRQETVELEPPWLPGCLLRLTQRILASQRENGPLRATRYRPSKAGRVWPDRDSVLLPIERDYIRRRPRTRRRLHYRYRSLGRRRSCSCGLRPAPNDLGVYREYTGVSEISEDVRADVGFGTKPKGDELAPPSCGARL
jgi:hypothetical protein